MTTGDGAGDVDRTRAEIDRRRAELGETVEALAARADVPARGREKAEQARNRLQERSTQAIGAVREKAAQLPAAVGHKMGQTQRRVGRMAADAGAQGARGAEVMGASANRAGGTVRHNPVPFALGAAVVIAVVATGWQRFAAARARRRSGWNADRLRRMAQPMTRVAQPVARLAQPMAPWWSAAARSAKRVSGSRLVRR